MRFETEPGFQAQVDFGEFQIENANGKVEKLYLFTMILGYSRKIYGEFIDYCDLPHFLDCHIHAFEFFGGVPEQILYDRMKNVYIGKLAGKTKFNDALMGLALHYGFAPMVAPANSPWVKGKIERPYTFIREGFWRGYGYINQGTANAELRDWLAEKDMRIHGTTHEVINDRYYRERPCLNLLPNGTIDTSYRIFRQVHKDCTVRFDCNRFVVPHKLVGEQVVLRVKDGKMRIFHNDCLVVTYHIPEGKGELVQDKRFYDALRKDREMNLRKYGSGRRLKGRAKRTISPKKPPHEILVDIRHLGIYEEAMKEVRP